MVNEIFVSNINVNCKRESDKWGVGDEIDYKGFQDTLSMQY